MIYTINLYDDEDSDFFIRTNCDIVEFSRLLNLYKNTEECQTYGYTYSDFFSILESEGYFVDVINRSHSDLRIYF